MISFARPFNIRLRNTRPLEAASLDAIRFDAAPSAAVSCRGVTKEFGSGETKTVALRGVDVAVDAGQLTLLVGPSGCGKTTLISIIAGLLYPTQGSVAVLGTELARLSGRGLVDFRARNIGFVFQQYNLLPALSAAENAAVPLVIAGWRRNAAVEQARQMLAQVGLAERADALPSQLSGGQQQRVAIARALIHQPRLLVCDEPTAALDASAGQTVMELIQRVAVEPDRVVIVVTHDNRVFGFADRVVQMNDGRVERIDRGGNGQAAAPLHVGKTIGKTRRTLQLSGGGAP